MPIPGRTRHLGTGDATKDERGEQVMAYLAVAAALSRANGRASTEFVADDGDSCRCTTPPP